MSAPKKQPHGRLTPTLRNQLMIDGIREILGLEPLYGSPSPRGKSSCVYTHEFPTRGHTQLRADS